jgi:GDPmannose 4,6-dehydratase
MWLMLQQDSPDDFVVATGIGASVRDFCQHAFNFVGYDWQDFVIQDPRYVRPTEVDKLIGDPTKVNKKLSWKADTSWEKLAEIMVEADLNNN